MPSPILWVMPHYSIERSPAPSLAVVEGMPTAKDAHQLPGHPKPSTRAGKLQVYSTADSSPKPANCHSTTVQVPIDDHAARHMPTTVGHTGFSRTATIRPRPAEDHDGLFQAVMRKAIT